MSKRVETDDVGDLALLSQDGTPAPESAMQEFCEIANGFLTQLRAWRKEYSTHGADDTASKEAQRDVINQILS